VVYVRISASIKTTEASRIGPTLKIYTAPKQSEVPGTSLFTGAYSQHDRWVG